MATIGHRCEVGGGAQRSAGTDPIPRLQVVMAGYFELPLEAGSSHQRVGDAGDDCTREAPAEGGGCTASPAADCD